MNDPVSPRALRASRGFLVLHGPRILAQKRQLDRVVERLPDAELPWEGKLEGPDPLRLAVIGDSTAAGTAPAPTAPKGGGPAPNQPPAAGPAKDPGKGAPAGGAVVKPA